MQATACPTQVPVLVCVGLVRVQCRLPLSPCPRELRCGVTEGQKRHAHEHALGLPSLRVPSRVRTAHTLPMTSPARTDRLPWQVTTSTCYVNKGQSGGPVFDLQDYCIIGVQTGYLPATPTTSFWVPITAQHYAMIQRWMWAGPDPYSDMPPIFPSPPPPPPFDTGRHTCE